MTQNIPLAIVLQTIGSFCFALSAYLQHLAVGEQTDGNQSKARIGLDQLWRSAKNPKWLLGALLMGVSLVMQVTALDFAPVSVVQPVGLLAFPWSIVIQSWAAKRKPERPVIIATVTTAGATMLITIITALNASHNALDQNRVFVGALVIYLLAMGLGWLGTNGPARWRSLFWATGGALFYGLEAALVGALQKFRHEYPDWMQSPAFWAILIALLLGSATAGWMVQQGYATGPAEIVVADMTITSPIVAVVFGFLVLGEGDRLTTLIVVALIVLALIAIGGVIWLTTMHPSFDDPIPESGDVADEADAADHIDPHMD